MAFGGLILTNSGRNEIASCIANEKTLDFTSVHLGDGAYAGSFNSIAKLTNKVMELPITSVTRKDNEVIIDVDWDYKQAPQGFYLREIGIIGNEKLCYYDNAGSGDAEYIDPDSEVLSKTKRFRFSLVITDEVNITIQTSGSIYALQKDIGQPEGIASLDEGGHVPSKELPVAGEALGAVKSGSGITVSSDGTVTVNDDSHNHIIDNVDGLQDALDAKIPATEKGKNSGVATLDGSGHVPDKELNLSARAVTGVKGDKETVYRKGEVNITPANIGARAVADSNIKLYCTLQQMDPSWTWENFSYETARSRFAPFILSTIIWGSDSKIAYPRNLIPKQIPGVLTYYCLNGTRVSATFITDNGEMWGGGNDNISSSNDQLLLWCKFSKSDTKDSTVTFSSADVADTPAPTSWATVTPLATGDTHATLFTKISTMFKNVRYLWKLLGSADISTIGNGTVTGAISKLNTDKCGKVQYIIKQGYVLGSAIPITPSPTGYVALILPAWYNIKSTQYRPCTAQVGENQSSFMITTIYNGSDGTAVSSATIDVDM